MLLELIDQHGALDMLQAGGKRPLHLDMLQHQLCCSTSGSHILTSSGYLRRRGGRPESAIGPVYMGPDVFESNIIVEHAHHVPG